MQGRLQKFLPVKFYPNFYTHFPSVRIHDCQGEADSILLQRAVSLRPFLKVKCRSVAKLMLCIRCLKLALSQSRYFVLKKCLYNYKVDLFLVCWCIRILHPADFSYPGWEGRSATFYCIILGGDPILARCADTGEKWPGWGFYYRWSLDATVEIWG